MTAAAPHLLLADDGSPAAAEAKGGVKDEESAAIEKIRAALGATGTS